MERTSNFDRCLAYLAKMPAAISGSGGHNATFAAACACIRFGLSDGEALQALAEYNLRSHPAWSERELAHKLADARKHAGVQAGVMGRTARGQARSLEPLDWARIRAEASGATRGVNTLGVNTVAPETRPNVEKSAKLPYRTPTVAIPPATLALAMERARAAVETMPGHLPGAPIIRQPLDIEEAYWAHVWRRLGRPDPGLTEGVKS